MTTLDFSKEKLDGIPRLVAPGLWLSGEAHCAGGIQNLKVNNRAFIFKLTLKESLAGVSKGKECLFVHGLGNAKTIEGVKNLEKETGLKVIALLCNGGGHHTFIKLWYDAFPNMKVWVCPTKVPSTENGKKLMKEYPDRWELVDNTTTPHHVHQLLHYFGSGDDMQVDCVLFNQLFGYTDENSGACGMWQHPEVEPVLKGEMYPLTTLGPLMKDVSQPLDDVMFFHKKSKLLVTGHHFEFAYTPKGHVQPKVR
jgi:hypothetical protein